MESESEPGTAVAGSNGGRPPNAACSAAEAAATSNPQPDDRLRAENPVTSLSSTFPEGDLDITPRREPA